MKLERKHEEKMERNALKQYNSKIQPIFTLFTKLWNNKQAQGKS